MKIFYGVLLCTLISATSYSQEKEKTKKDSIKQKTVKLDEVIVSGKLKKIQYLALHQTIMLKKSCNLKMLLISLITSMVFL